MLESCSLEPEKFRCKLRFQTDWYQKRNDKLLKTLFEIGMQIQMCKTWFFIRNFSDITIMQIYDNNPSL